MIESILEIPDSVARAMRLPPAERPRQLKVELALSLYAQGILSLSKARELAGVTKLEFGPLLGKWNIAHHFG
jgi:predicted HTH domain antitoxin